MWNIYFIYFHFLPLTANVSQIGQIWAQFSKRKKYERGIFPAKGVTRLRHFSNKLYSSINRKLIGLIGKGSITFVPKIWFSQNMNHVALNCDSATRRASPSSSMVGEPEYFALPQRERTKLCKNINRLKRIHEAWETIAHNLTDPTILHIDVRRLNHAREEHKLWMGY